MWKGHHVEGAASSPPSAPARERPAVVGPPRLEDYRDRHLAERILVCGCGRSLAAATIPDGVVTIGVNDVGRRFDPSYLVVVNPRRSFSDERWQAIESSRAQAVFTQLDLGLQHLRVVRFELGRRGGTELNERGRLPYTGNSPYVAAGLARWMGARRIGLIGVDLTDGHFFGETGAHPLQRSLAAIDAEYAALAQAFADGGCEVVNLSPVSRLESLPRMSLADFAPPASCAPPTIRPIRRIRSIGPKPVDEYVRSSLWRIHARELPVRGEARELADGIGARFILRLQGEAIVELDYRSTSCATLRACCEALVELLVGTRLDDALAVDEGLLLRCIRGLHPGRKDRIALALSALHSALLAARRPAEVEA